MTSYREVIHIRTRHREEVVHITAAVKRACAKSGISEGLALIFPRHTSAAVYVSDCDGALTEDFRAVMGQLAPEGRSYAHNANDHKRNAHAHLRATLTGHHCIVPITGAKLDLGAYQAIYYAEFDGQRPKEILVKIIGG